MDSLSLTVRVTRPLVSVEGKSVENEYHYKLANSKFCVDVGYAWRVYAYLEGKYILENPIRVEYRGIWKDDFKWAVEKNVNIAKNPELLNYEISIDTSEKSWGFSITRNAIFFSDSRPIDGMFSWHWLGDLFKMMGKQVNTQSSDSLFELWDKLYPGTIEKKVWYPVGNTWTINKPKLLLDYFMFQRKDSLFFAPGPLVKTQFAVGSLDTPVCNFGRMPPPPPIGDAAWKDTLLVAVGDSVVIDGFYVHFPWANIWGKANISRKVKRTKSKIEVNVSHIFAKVGDTKPFVYFDSGDENRKCLTKVEAMWEGDYKTIFIGER